MQRHYGQEPQCILTMPLLEGLDGVEKMSKSKNNYIGITESPFDMFSKTMSISDELMWRWYDLLSLRSNEEIRRSRGRLAKARNPRDVKVLLAKEIVARFHSEQAAETAAFEFMARFKAGAMPNDMPEVCGDGRRNRCSDSNAAEASRTCAIDERSSAQHRAGRREN